MRDMIAEKMELQERGWKVIFFLLPVIGLAMVIWGSRQWGLAAAPHKWPRVPGKVTASKVEKIVQDGKTLYEPRISFRYTATNIDFVSDRLWLNPEDGRTPSEEEARTTTLNLAVGDPVIVHYDPEQPDQGVVNIISRENFALPLGLGSLLIIMFLLTEIHHHVTKDPEDQALHLDDDPAAPAPATEKPAE